MWLPQIEEGGDAHVTARRPHELRGEADWTIIIRVLAYPLAQYI